MKLTDKFHLTARERAERMAFIHLRPLMEKHVTRIVEKFYVELLRVKAGQRAYLLSLFSEKLDEARFEICLHIGHVHERIGLPIKWYVSSMANFFERIVTVIEFQTGLKPERLLTAVLALNKIMDLDLQLALESYASLSTRVRKLGQQLQSTAAALNQAVRADRLNDE